MTVASYPSIFNLGHKILNDLWAEPVVVQEKVDGSQFSFGVKGGVLGCRSKGQQIDMDNPPKMFAGGVEYLKTISDKLLEGWTYRGEYLNKPRHNILTYGRAPKNFIVLFDIELGEQDFLEPKQVETIGSSLGLDVVPTYHHGKLDGFTPELQELIKTKQSLLGGAIEGVVIKNYSRYGVDKKILIGKAVRTEFKEAHKKEFNVPDPEAGVVTKIVKALATKARWQKAVQHLRDAGTLLNAPQDIKPLLDEIIADTFKEELDWIKEQLFAAYRKEITRGLVKGFPEWYKEQLANPAEEFVVAEPAVLEGA